MRINSFAAGASLAASLAAALAIAPEPAAAAVGYYTYHFNNDRTGWNPNETILTAAAVSSGHFHLLRFLAADSVVYAQPLYAPGITVGSTKHNLAIVASENDSVYAYDADSGALVWKRSLIAPSAGITAVSVSSVGGCGQSRRRSASRRRR